MSWCKIMLEGRQQGKREREHMQVTEQWAHGVSRLVKISQCREVVHSSRHGSFGPCTLSWPRFLFSLAMSGLYPLQ
jgi:hypothetical protein